MCERGIQTAIEAAILCGQLRDAGLLSPSEFRVLMTELADYTAGLIASTDNPEQTFRDFLAETRAQALAHAGVVGQA